MTQMNILFTIIISIAAAVVITYCIDRIEQFFNTTEQA